MRFLVAVLVLACPAHGSDQEGIWSAQWRTDPQRSGAVAAPGPLLQELPDGGPTPAWRIELGRCQGHGGPSLADGRVFFAGPLPVRDGKRFLGWRNTVLAVGLERGEQRWRTELPTELKPSWSTGGGTPAVVDGRVFATLAALERPPGEDGKQLWGSVVCCDAADGSVLWQREQEATAAGFAGYGGLQSSPLVVDGTCVVAGTEVVAYDTRSGAERWRLPFGRAYASPVLASIGGEPHVVVLALDPGRDRELPMPVHGERRGGLLIACALADGAPRWALGCGRDMWLSPTPLAVGDLLVVEEPNVLAAWDCAGEEPVTAWRVDHRAAAGHVGASPLLLGDRVWYLDGRAALCVDLAAGEVRETGFAPASRDHFPSAAGIGELLCYLAADGDTPHVHLLHQGTETTPLGSFPVPDLQPHTSPAFGDGRMVLRTVDGLVCYDLRAAE